MRDFVSQLKEGGLSWAEDSGALFSPKENSRWRLPRLLSYRVWCARILFFYPNNLQIEKQSLFPPNFLQPSMTSSKPRNSLSLSEQLALLENPAPTGNLFFTKLGH